MKFADEMKMLLQLQQQTKDNNPDVDLIRGDCDRLHKKLMTALKEHIRHMLVTESYPEKIEGDFELPLRPSVTCKKIPRVPQTKQFYSYTTKNAQPVMTWEPICTASAAGGLFSDKSVTVTLTPAGEALLSRFMQEAEAEGISLRYFPAVMTRTGRVRLEKFGTPAQIDNPMTVKGTPLHYCVLAHYEIK